MKKVALILCGIAATFFAGFAAVLGAEAAGLPEGGWNLQFLAPLFLGWIGGAFITIIVAILLRRATVSAQLTGILLAAPAAASLVAAAVTVVALFPAKQMAADHEEFLGQAWDNPALVRELVARSRTETLTRLEHWNLSGVIWFPNQINQDEIPHLLEFFKNDTNSIVGLITRQRCSSQQLRDVYQRYKSDPGNRVGEELISVAETPVDVLNDIVTHNVRYPENKYSDYIIVEAEKMLRQRTHGQ